MYRVYWEMVIVGIFNCSDRDFCLPFQVEKGREYIYKILMYQCPSGCPQLVYRTFIVSRSIEMFNRW